MTPKKNEIEASEDQMGEESHLQHPDQNDVDGRADQQHVPEHPRQPEPDAAEPADASLHQVVEDGECLAQEDLLRGVRLEAQQSLADHGQP